MRSPRKMRALPSPLVAISRALNWREEKLKVIRINGSRHYRVVYDKTSLFNTRTWDPYLWLMITYSLKHKTIFLHTACIVAECLQNTRCLNLKNPNVNFFDLSLLVSLNRWCISLLSVEHPFLFLFKTLIFASRKSSDCIYRQRLDCANKEDSYLNKYRRQNTIV